MASAIAGGAYSWEDKTDNAILSGGVRCSRSDGLDLLKLAINFIGCVEINAKYSLRDFEASQQHQSEDTGTIRDAVSPTTVRRERAGQDPSSMETLLPEL
eukprot:3940814-Rhodomonas_salina.1